MSVRDYWTERDLILFEGFGDRTSSCRIIHATDNNTQIVTSIRFNLFSVQKYNLRKTYVLQVYFIDISHKGDVRVVAYMTYS